MVCIQYSIRTGWRAKAKGLAARSTVRSKRLAAHHKEARDEQKKTRGTRNA